MFRQLSFRDRLVAMAVAPLLVLATVAVGLLIFINSSGTRPYGLFAVIGLVVAGLISFAAGRSIVASLNGLTMAASAMAEAHRSMSFGEAVMPKPIETVGGDEVTKLAEAINGINAAVIDADRSHHDEVRQGLRGIVTNLARRSQTLLDRQVEYLDRLETSEQDPDRLGELFKVDHLATRMRRNAESLIVLAEADPGRRRGGPVDVADVLRVAMGEVEIYQQIKLLTVDDGKVNAGIAVDLAHLVAELMENATQFSPPDAAVEVTGRFDGEGSFVITIVDQGMGMTDEKLVATNGLLANPPELGLGMSRSLGFMVIGRLAQRLNAAVIIRRNDPGVGLAAVVTVPAELFVPTNNVGSNGSARGAAQVAATTSIAAAMDPSDDAESAVNVLLPPVVAVKPDGDTAEMLTPPVPPSAANNDRAAACEPSVETEDPDALGRLLGTVEHEPEAAEQHDWGVGSLVEDQSSGYDDAAVQSDGDDGQISNEQVVVGPAPMVPLTRSTEVTTGSNPPLSDEWIPPTVTPATPSKLSDAMPSGEAFESGVASLLDDHPTGPTTPPERGNLRDDDATAAGLVKRHRGASDVPFGQGRPVAASKRDPEEVRSRLSRYREGLSGRKPKPVARSARAGQPDSKPHVAAHDELNQTKSEGR